MSSNFPTRPGKPPEMLEAVYVRAWGSLRHNGEAWLARGYQVAVNHLQPCPRPQESTLRAQS